MPRLLEVQGLRLMLRFRKSVLDPYDPKGGNTAGPAELMQESNNRGTDDDNDRGGGDEDGGGPLARFSDEEILEMRQCCSGIVALLGAE